MILPDEALHGGLIYFINLVDALLKHLELLDGIRALVEAIY